MKYFSIIFDDGPQEPLCEMVDKIKEFGWSAGFAVIGKKINDENEYMLKHAINSGFQLISHGQNHICIDKLNTTEEMTNELLAPIEEIKRRMGYKVTMARLPFLSENDKVLQLARKLNLPLLGQGIEWVTDWDSNTTPELIARTVIESAKEGAIGCLHVSKNTCLALDEILPALSKNGFGIMTPEELFKRAGIIPPLGIQISNINNLKGC